MRSPNPSGQLTKAWSRRAEVRGSCLALGTYSASGARTQDANFADQVRYRVGSDLQLVEMGWYDQAKDRWEIPPVFIHEQVPGIERWARVDRFVGTCRIGQEVLSKKAQVLGVDSLDLAQVGWFRDDFAQEPLGSLMDTLSRRYDAILASRSLLKEYPLRVGDKLVLRVDDVDIDFTLRGFVDYFPTLYPDEGHFFIGNLDYVYLFVEEGPYEVWARTSGRLDLGLAQSILGRWGLSVSEVADSRTLIEEGREEPTRTGIYGLLSLGFVISTVATAMGFLGSSFVSLRKQSGQLGILRAIGLSPLEVVWLVVFEQAFLVAAGMAVGTLLGLLTGRLFIPFLKVGTSARALVPPFVVITPWGDLCRLYLVLALVLVAALGGSIWLLLRIKVHQAVKLGETQL